MDPFFLLAIGTAIAIAALCCSSGVGGLWLLDPRAAASGLLYLHSCGYLLYFAMTGKYSPVFGLEGPYIDKGNIILVSAQAGFLLGTFLVPTSQISRMPPLQVDAETERWLYTVLAIAIVVTALPMVYTVATDWGSMVTSRYGSSQGDERGDIVGKYARLSNIVLISIPTLLILFVARGATGRKLGTPLAWFLGLLCFVPNFLSGGRKDIFIIIGGIFLAWSFKLKRKPWREVAILALGLAVLSQIITRSRSGSTLGLEDRMAAVEETEGGDVIEQLSLMYAGLPNLTAAMAVFPRYVAYTNGRSYVEAAANVASPAFITGRYPFMPMAHQFRELYYAQVKGYGFDYAMSAEAYQNFGETGPFFVFALFGWILACTHRLASERRRSINPWLLIHLTTLMAVLYGLRTDSNGLFKMAIYSAVWVIGLLILARTLARLFMMGVWRRSEGRALFQSLDQSGPSRPAEP